MAKNLNITVEDYSPGFTKLASTLDLKKVFPNTLQALNLVAINHLVKWREFTQGAPIPGTPRIINSRGDYTKSINADLNKDQLKEIYSKGPWTDWIEKGHGQIDLKPGMLRGPKARQGKNGAYNIIPFRHGVPNSLKSNNPMPSNVYNYMKKETNRREAAGDIGKSKIVGKGPETINRANGTMDLKLKYQWGSKLPASLGGTPKTKFTTYGSYTWKTGKYTGMVRMDTSTKRKTTSEYLTFRVVSIHSPASSWIVPPMEPLLIRRAVVDSLREETEKILKMAIEEDLK
jgi:hypothetical protein